MEIFLLIPRGRGRDGDKKEETENKKKYSRQ